MVAGLANHVGSKELAADASVACLDRNGRAPEQVPAPLRCHEPRQVSSDRDKVASCATRKAFSPRLNAALSAGAIPPRAAARACARRLAISLSTCRPARVRISCTSRRLLGCDARSIKPAASRRSHSRLAVGSPMSSHSAKAVRFKAGDLLRVRNAFDWAGDNRIAASCTAPDHRSARLSTASEISRAMASGSPRDPLACSPPRSSRCVTNNNFQ